jgi:hypothetical protein
VPDGMRGLLERKTRHIIQIGTVLSERTTQRIANTAKFMKIPVKKGGLGLLFLLILT